ncbi:MAG: 50S ribosomal protein L24 [Patescibacteria group bacterium]
MYIKKNDTVKILAGKDKGKTGKVLQILPEEGRASVEGLNLLIKHLRPRKSGEKGQRIEFPSFVDISNLALVCPKCGKTTRAGAKIIPSSAGQPAKKSRVCKKCQEVIE